MRPIYPGIILIPNNAIRVASYELKRLYNENFQVFHEVCGVEQALIQKFVIAVDEQYIISMKNRTIGQFTGNIRQIFSYLLSKYGNTTKSFERFQKRSDRYAL